MAVRFDAATDELSLTSSPLDYNSPYTWMGWFCIDVDTNAVATFLAVHNDTVNARDFLRTQSDGTSLQLRVEQSATTGSSANGSALTVGTWYHIAIVRESVSALKLYLNGVLDATNTTNITSRVAATEMQVGLFRSSNPLNGRAAYLKSWSVALDAAQVAAEMRAVRPLYRLDALHGWWPTRPGERTKDYSGNGRNWTDVGTSDEDAPPVAWGARIGRRFRAGATTYNQAIGGTLTSSGALVKQTTKSLAGTLTSTGALVRRTTKILAGTLTSSGALTAARVFLKAIGGTLTSSGALVKTTTKTLAGTLTSSGALVRRTTKILAGTLSSAGALVKQTRKVLGGTLTSSGGAAILRAVAYLRNRFRVSADAPADIPALGRSFTVAADAPAQIPAGGRSFTVAADAASEQL